MIVAVDTPSSSTPIKSICRQSGSEDIISCRHCLHTAEAILGVFRLEFKLELVYTHCKVLKGSASKISKASSAGST